MDPFDDLAVTLTVSGDCVDQGDLLRRTVRRSAVLDLFAFTRKTWVEVARATNERRREGSGRRRAGAETRTPLALPPAAGPVVSSGSGCGARDGGLALAHLASGDSEASLDWAAHAARGDSADGRGKVLDLDPVIPASLALLGRIEKAPWTGSGSARGTDRVPSPSSPLPACSR